MAELIYVDDAGNELKRETKGRGRPPRGAEKQEDGNWIVRPVEQAKTVGPVMYIDLDDSGNEISRRPKGRGRAKEGYTKVTEGENQGHWVKTITEKKESVESSEVSDVPTVVETEEVVEVS